MFKSSKSDRQARLLLLKREEARYEKLVTRANPGTGRDFALSRLDDVRIQIGALIHDWWR